ASSGYTGITLLFNWRLPSEGWVASAVPGRAMAGARTSRPNILIFKIAAAMRYMGSSSYRFPQTTNFNTPWLCGNGSFSPHSLAEYEGNFRTSGSNRTPAEAAAKKPLGCEGVWQESPVESDGNLGHQRWSR